MKVRLTLSVAHRDCMIVVLMMTPEEEAQVDIVPRGGLGGSLVLSFKLCLPPSPWLLYKKHSLEVFRSLPENLPTSRGHVRANKIKMASFKVTFN